MGVCSDQCFNDYVHKARDKHDRRLASRAKPRTPTTPPHIRRRVKKRDGNRCRFCGTGDGLEVHHIIYRSQGGEDVDVNLITLCGEHHAQVHSDKPRYEPLCLSYIAELGAGRRLSLAQLERWQKKAAG